VKEFLNWLFADPDKGHSLLSVVAWWEKRRIPFNIIVGLYGAICFVIFSVAIETSGHLQPGEDAVEPIILIVAPVGINILYTLGWLVEVPVRFIRPTLSAKFGPVLFKLGLGLGLLLITMPAAFWGGYRFLQLVGFLS